MTCADWQDRFTEYLDNTLPADAHQQLEAHLAACPDCAADLAAFRATVSVLSSLPRVQPPEDMLARISAAIDAEAAEGAGSWKARRWNWSQISALAAAACLLLGLVAVFRGDLTGALLSAEKGAQMAQPQASRPLPAEKAATPAPATEKEVDSDGIAAGADSAPAELEGAAPVREASGAPASASAASTRASAGREKTRRDAGTRGAVPDTGPMRAESRPTARLETVRPPAPATVPTREESAPRFEDLLDAGHSALSTSVARELGEPDAFAMELPVPAGVAGAREGFAGATGKGGAGGEPAMPGAPMPAGPRATAYTADAPLAAPSMMATKSADVAIPGVTDGFLMTFIPPRVREVGRTGTAAVVIEPQSEVGSAVVTVKPDTHLKVTNADPRGVVYSGRLRAQRRTTLALNLVATESGTRELRIGVASERPEVRGRLDVEIPGFTPAPADAAGDVERKSPDITIEFDETPVRDALLAVGRQSGLAVKVGPEVAGPRINARFQEVPAEAALRMLCEEGNYRLEVREDGFAVAGP
ncbi:MAG: zf-HC2 domain-containing protein [Armatimonadetes bacterium]|nr:zf-HC2 domain-containing protein [Armatimonadota bacterium]